MLVIDASIAACWLLPSEADRRADLALEQLSKDGGIAPDLWRHEMRNILLMQERRGRIDSAFSTRAFALLAQLPIRIDSSADEAMTLALARRHGLTAYDAAYLELALRQACALATLDTALAQAALAESVPVFA